jgi:hypothetical protein
MNAGRGEPERTQRKTELMTADDSGLYGDGETVASTGSELDGGVETTNWPASAPDPDELTRKQEEIIDTVADQGTQFNSLREVADQCSAARTTVRETLRTYWSEKYKEIRTDRQVRSSQTRETKNVISALKTGSSVCVSCDKLWAKDSDWRHCPHCGELLHTLQPVTGGDE